jgi:hypothetical protein
LDENIEMSLGKTEQEFVLLGKNLGKQVFTASIMGNVS